MGESHTVGALLRQPGGFVTHDGSVFPLFDLEAKEEDPDREHRDEHAKDDPGSYQISASESVHQQPQPAGEDQPGAELTDEEPSEAVAGDASLGMGSAEGHQCRQGYVDQPDRHQFEAERLAALTWDQQRRRGRERHREQPEHDLSPAPEHWVVDHRTQMQGDRDKNESEQGGARGDQRDAEVVPCSRVVCRIHLWTLYLSSDIRLLRQSGGFEGFAGVEEIVDPNRLAVPQLNHVPDRRLDLGPAHPATPTKLANRDDSVAHVPDLSDLDANLRESVAEIPVELANPVVSAVHRELTPEHREKRQMLDDLGIELLEVRFEVSAVEGVKSALERLDVLLRHRL